MIDHEKLQELLNIKAQAPVGFRFIIGSDARTELSFDMHDSALFAFSCMFGHVSQSEKILTMMAVSKVAA